MVRWVQLAGLTLLLVCCAAVAPVLSAEAAAQTLPVPQKLQIAGLAVDAWIPDSQTPGPWPIVLFSHRYCGCNTQSSFLMQLDGGRQRGVRSQASRCRLRKAPLRRAVNEIIERLLQPASGARSNEARLCHASRKIVVVIRERCRSTSPISSSDAPLRSISMARL